MNIPPKKRSKNTGIFFSFVFLFSFLYSTPQNIYTVAGNGTSGFSGNGGAATSASLYYPVGITTDTSGNLFIADHYNHCIRKVDNAGIINTIAGSTSNGFSGDGNQASLAQFNLPSGMTTDMKGNLYIADYFNSRIRKIDPGGIITTIAGNGVYGNSGNGGLATLAKLGNPYNVQISKSGAIYFTDEGFHCVRKIDTTGVISLVAGTGIPGFSGDGGNAVAAQFEFPQGLAIDHQGNIYVGDTYNMRIRKIDSQGIISTIAGTGFQGSSGDGGPALLAKLDNPTAVAVDINGTIFISEVWGNRIRKINSSGIISTICGTGVAAYSGDGGPAVMASIKQPSELHIKGCDLYINDSGNNRIRIIKNIIAPEVNIQPESINACSGDSIMIKVDTPWPNVTYQWFFNNAPVTGANLPVFVKPNASSNDAGRYFCTILTTCGLISSDTVSIAISQSPAALLTKTVCVEEKGILFVHDSTISVSWNPSYHLFSGTAESVNYYFEQPGIYSYEIVHTGPYCVYNQTASVIVSSCKISIPNVVTQNNDGVNDTWFIAPNDIIETLDVTIMNRWGNVVFEKKNQPGLSKDKGWKPENISSGTYFYLINYTSKNGQQQTVKGNITVF